MSKGCNKFTYTGVNVSLQAEAAVMVEGAVAGSG